MPKKKILFVLSRSLGWRTYQEQLIRVARTRDDIEPSFYICQPSIPERVVMYNLPTMPIRRLVDPFFVWARHLGAWWRKTGQSARYDAVHVATQDNAVFFAELRSGPPYSVAIDVTRPIYSQLWSSRRAIAAERRLFERAAMIFPMSDWAAQSLMDDHGIDRAKISVIPPSLSRDGVEVHRPDAGPGQVDIAFIGNDFHRKGGDVLLRIHQAELSDRAQLHVVSNGFKPGPKLDNVIHYTNLAHEKILKEFLPSMDLFCMPTLYDMSPWVCVEAQAAGLPIVVTDIGAVSELCVDGETGFVVEDGDEASLSQRLSQLVADGDLRRRLGEGGHELFRTRFSADVNYNRLIDRILQTC